MFFFYTDKGKLVEMTIGDSVTISCKIDVKDQKSLTIKRGLVQNDDIFSTDGDSFIISNEFKSRLKYHIQAFPSVNLTIHNLTVEDTGTYWCIYVKTDQTLTRETGNGSLILVVKGEQIKS